MCPEIPLPADDSEDAQSRWAGGMIDQYAACAVRHNRLVRWHEKR